MILLYLSWSPRSAIGVSAAFDKAHCSPAAMTSSRFATAGFALFALFFASVLAFLDRQLLNILIRPIRADVGISDVQFSLLQGAAFALVYSLAAFPMAYVADRFGRKQVILASIVVWSAMTVLFGMASSFAWLLAARVGLAIGEAGLSPAAISIVRQIYPQERQSFAVAILTISVYVGGGISMTVGGPALAALESHAASLPLGLAPWRLLFVACAVLGVIGVLLLALMPEPRQAAQTPATSSLAEFFRLLRLQQASVVAYLTAFVGLNALAYAVMAWTPAMFMRSHDWTERQIGLAYGLTFIIGGIVGALGSGRWVGQLLQRGSANATVKVIRIAALLLGTATLLSATVPDANVALAFTAVGMVAMGSLIALGAFGFQAMFPKAFSARAVAVYFLVPGTLGASLGPSAVPLLQRALGSGENLGLALGMLAIALSLWAAFWLGRLLRAPQIDLAAAPNESA